MIINHHEHSHHQHHQHCTNVRCLALISVVSFQFDQGSKHTDTRKFSRDTVSILKEATDQNSEINKKVEELLKGGK